MNGNKFLTSVAIIFSLMFMGSFMTTIEGSDNQDVIITIPEKPEAEISVKNGENFILQIKSNITTGYSWEIDGKLDEGKLEFKGKIEPEDIHEARPDKQPMLGASGFEYLRFHTVGSGNADINLKLVRPWEKTAEPSKRCKVKLTIK